MKLFNWFKRNSSPLAPHLELGARGEKWAARHLRRQGYKILVRQFRGKAGEIDIVARDHDTLVFVEVKTRQSEKFGLPQEAVDLKKQRHIAKVAWEYVRLLHNQQIKMRFDIVEVIMQDGARQPDDIRIIQNAFELPAPYQY